MKDENDLNSTKMDQRGKTPDRQKKKNPGSVHVGLWWTKWHWDRFFPEYFGFPLPISLHRCSITLKNGEKNLIIFLFIFITGLHNKP
jgi:hypothetical protein